MSFSTQFSSFRLMPRTWYVGAKKSLLAASPLGPAEVYAAVNDYTPDFDPCNKEDFRHLVSVSIANGSFELLGFIRYIASTLGTYVKADLGPNHKHIALVVETTRKLFPTQAQFQFHADKITTVNFDYVGRKLRCCFCFSYRHHPAKCRQPRPAFLANKDLGAAFATEEGLLRH